MPSFLKGFIATAVNANCEIDSDQNFCTLQEIQTHNNSQENNADEVDSGDAGDRFQNNSVDVDNDSPTTNVLAYISGYLIKEIVSGHECEACEVLSNRSKKLTPNNAFLEFKTYRFDDQGESALKYPSEAFHSAVCDMEKRMSENVHSLLHKDSMEKQFISIVYDVLLLADFTVWRHYT